MKTLRRQSERLFLFAAFVVVACLALYVTIAPPGSSHLIDRFEVAAYSWVALWALLLMSKSRVIITDNAITIVNWFVRWKIPWSAVRTVEAGTQLRIVLTDGSAVRPAIGGRSLLGQMQGNPTQKRLAQEILAYRPSPAVEDGACVSRRLDLCPAQSVVILAIFVTITLLAHLPTNVAG